MQKILARLLSLTALCFLFLLVSCGQEATSAQNDVTIKPPGTPDEYLLAVGELAPRFGGYFYGDQGILNIYILGLAAASQKQKDDVVAAMVRVYGEGILSDGIRQYPSTPQSWLDDPPLKLLDGNHSMVDLYTWYQRLNELHTVLSDDVRNKISSFDLDEGKNRLRIGVIEESVISTIQAGLKELGIPVDAVAVEVESPIWG